MTNVSVNPITAPGQSTTLTRASAQWRDRPEDERYSSIEALRAAAHAYRDSASERVVRLRDAEMSYDEDELLLDGKRMTNWAFGQLAQRTKAPAAYIRTLPSDLALQCMKHGLRSSDPAMPADKVMVADGRVSAITSERYVRLWNAEIADWLVTLQGAQPWWSFPVAFRQAGGETKQGAWGESKELPVAFLSDHDMFVFLADYEHAIEIPDCDTPLNRGFWIENSETGASAIRITLFLFDFVCSNVLVWGARNVVEVKVNHVGRARERVLFDDSEARLAIEEYANRSTREDVQRIVQARKTLVADTREEVINDLYGMRLPGLTKTILEQAYATVERTPRYGDPRSIWGVVNGLTEVSQRLPHADARTEVDRSAGKILDAVTVD